MIKRTNFAFRHFLSLRIRRNQLKLMHVDFSATAAFQMSEHSFIQSCQIAMNKLKCCSISFNDTPIDVRAMNSRGLNWIILRGFINEIFTDSNYLVVDWNKLSKQKWLEADSFHEYRTHCTGVDKRWLIPSNKDATQNLSITMKIINIRDVPSICIHVVVNRIGVKRMVWHLAKRISGKK